MLDSHTKKNKSKSISESNCQRRVLTKTYGLETKIQIQLDLHLQRSRKIGTNPNVNGRGSIALLKRSTKSKFPNANQTYQSFIYYQTNKT